MSESENKVASYSIIGFSKMETVMELLGHTDIRTTQIYGKVVQKKISDDMNKLRDRLQKNRS